MVSELSVVALIHDVAEYHLKKGDHGTVVHCYGDGKAYEVEFIGDDGRTKALLTLTDADIGSVSKMGRFGLGTLIYKGISQTINESETLP